MRCTLFFLVHMGIAGLTTVAVALASTARFAPESARPAEHVREIEPGPASAESHWVHCPTGGFSATFDGRGVALRADAGSWDLGLDLARFGFPGREQEIDGRACVTAEGARFSYAWDDALTEWFVNGSAGLEHGYTLRARPEGTGMLTFTLAASGFLAARVRVNGDTVSFSDASGVASLDYAGLHVFDATGRTLPSGFEVVAGGMRIWIDESQATYPLTIDPIFQQAYVKASNAESQDFFGRALAASGDTIVVGSNMEASAATGVGGNELDNSAPAAGAAYVYVRSAGTWTQEAYLKASNTGSSDTFATAVAISGDTLVIGAPGEASNATGVNGNELDNSALNSGAAYVFVRNGTTWTQQAYLKASNSESADSFGGAVAISGDTIAIGAIGEASNAAGVNGNSSDNSLPEAGAVYVFVRSGTTWTQQAYVKASNPGFQDWFGGSVTINGDTLVVGATREDSAATGVNGNQASNSSQESGAAYVFVRSGTTWTQQAYLKASNTGAGDAMGRSVAVYGDTLAVGATWEASNATGVNGNQANNSALGAGAVYVFARSGVTWTQQAYVKASNAQADDYFSNVALYGDLLAVGAEGEDSAATGIDGNQLDQAAGNSGAVYLFARSGTAWTQVAYVKSSNPDPNDQLSVIALSNDLLVAGAPGESSSATGVNGNQADNSASAAGAAYVFDLASLSAGTAYCAGDGSGATCPCGNAVPPGTLEGCANSLGSGGRLRGTGEPKITADTLQLLGSQMPNGPCLYLQGTAQLGSPLGAGVVFGDGLRCVGGTLIRLGPKTNVNGASRFPEPADGSLSARGLVTTPGARHYQVWFRDSAAFCTSSTFSLTNGLSLVWTF